MPNAPLQLADISESDKERFWSRIDKNGPIPTHRPELGPCWIWMRSKHGGGYGLTWINGRHERTHRVSYTLAIGEIPRGLGVLHSCDNPPCGNPAHLFVGTQAQNMDDMVKKGRVATGERNGRFTMPHRTPRGEARGSVKLTDEKIRNIRKEHAEGGVSMRSLGRKHGVKHTTISGILSRAYWSHVT